MRQPRPRSRTSILEANANLLTKFDVRGNAALAAYIANQKTRLEMAAREYLVWETKIDKDRDERFE
jgi:hypothetical protein